MNQYKDIKFFAQRCDKQTSISHDMVVKYLWDEIDELRDFCEHSSEPKTSKPLSLLELKDIVWSAKGVTGSSSLVTHYIEICKAVEEAHGIK